MEAFQPRDCIYRLVLSAYPEDAMTYSRLALLAIILFGFPGVALAQSSGDHLRLSVMNDQSGHYNSATGPGAVVSAQMAVDDFGDKVLGKTIEVVALDHQNKPDIGLSLARRFYEADDGEAIFDIGNSAISLGVQRIARERGKIVVHIGSIHPDLFGKECSPTGAMWQYDSGALTKGLVQAVTKEGGTDWFIIGVDYTAGKALADDETRLLKLNGGRVAGIARHPLGAQDFASQLLTAASSGASVLGLASFGADAQNLIKQANEFNLNMRIAAPVLTLADVHSLGPDVAHGLLYTSAFYWDRDQPGRTFAARFAKRFDGKMPTEGQAATYSAVSHYLKAIAAAGTSDGLTVMNKMKELPVDDVFAHEATLRVDGRLMKDLYLVEVKNKGEVKDEWDLLKTRLLLKAEDVIRPLGEGDCPFVK
jgi:branched-chain amino acid transport system substrate-binding protein